MDALVYTERVGGSSPSPPTIRRRALASVFGLILAAWGLAPMDAAFAEGASMTFRVEPLEAGRCGARCPHVIVADGVIETSTPQAFVDFLKSGAEDRNLRRIVFFNSRGGNVVASMAFGHILRELRVAGVVGRFHISGDSGPYVGECLSACVYAMMGAVRRVAPPASVVALHRMSAPSPMSSDLAEPRLVALVARYAQRMGVDPALVRSAESLAPGAVRVLTRREIRAWRLATARF